MRIIAGLKAGRIRAPRIVRFLVHLVNKIPQWWEISGAEYQTEMVWATDDEQQHEKVCEILTEAGEKIMKVVEKDTGIKVEVKRTKRSKRV